MATDEGEREVALAQLRERARRGQYVGDVAASAQELAAEHQSARGAAARRGTDPADIAVGFVGPAAAGRQSARGVGVGGVP